MSVKFYFLPDELGSSDDTLIWQVNLAERILLESRDLESSFEESKQIFIDNKEKNLKFENPLVWDYIFNGSGDGVSYLSKTFGVDFPAVFSSIVAPAIKNDPQKTIKVLESSYPNLVTILSLDENKDFGILHQRSL